MKQCILRLMSLFLIACTPCMHGTEFLYPVAAVDGGTSVCVVYQKTASHIELWLWNPSTKRIHQGLLSRFTPGGVRLLPNSRSFSFVDNGIVMVKEFIKRSPGSLELSQPIYDISLLNWIDMHTCYMSAKKRNCYGIFQMTRYGDVATIMWDDVHDYLYPQRIGDALFCVERTTYKQACHYCIIKMPYPSIDQNYEKSLLSDEDSFCASDVKCVENKIQRSILGQECKSLIVDANVRPVSFLSMVSGREGYYVSHPPKVSAKTALLELEYYKISGDDGGWRDEKLFTFTVPVDFLLFNRELRLYESILPLLPLHEGDSIYYMSTTMAEHGGNLNMFRYHIPTGSITQVSWGRHEGVHYFRPLNIGSRIIYGGSLCDHDEGKVLMWIGEDGEVYADFPEIIT